MERTRPRGTTWSQNEEGKPQIHGTVGLMSTPPIRDSSHGQPTEANVSHAGTYGRSSLPGGSTRAVPIFATAPLFP